MGNVKHHRSAGRLLLCLITLHALLITAALPRAAHACTSNPGDGIWCWEGDVSGIWRNSGNWDEGSIPANGSDVEIPSTKCGTCSWPTADNSGNATMRDLTLQSGSQLTFNLVTRNFSIRRAFNNQGATITHQSGDVIFSGASGPCAVSGNTTGANKFTDVEITATGANSCVMQNAAKLEVGGTFRLSTGTLNMGNNATQAELIMDASAALTWTGTFSEGNGIVTIKGNTDVPIDRFYDLVIAGTSSITAAMTTATGRDVANNLTINSGATLSANGFALDVGGSWTNNGTFNASSGMAVRFVETGVAGAHSVGGSTTFTDVTFGDGTAGSTTFASGAAITVMGAASIAANHTLTSGGTFTFNSGSTWTDNGTFAPGTGTFVWKNAAALPRAGGGAGANETHYNLNVQLPNATDLADVATTPLTVSNNLLIASGNLNDGVGAATINVGGTWTNSVAGIDCASGDDGFRQDNTTVVMTGAASQMATDECFNNLTIGDASGDATAVSTGKDIRLTNTGIFTITAGATYSAGNGTFFRANSLSSTGTFTPQQSTVEWRGGAVTTNVTNFYNLTVNSATASIGAATTVSNKFQILSSGALDTAGFNLLVGQDFDIQGTLSDTSGSKATLVEFNGGGSQTVTGAATINVSKLRLNKSGGTLLLNQSVTTSSTAGSGTVTVDAGTLDLGNATLTANGSVTVNGGTLKLLGTPTLALAGGKTLTIASGGALSTGGSGPTITHSVAGTYTFTVNGTVDISRLNVGFADASGMKINMNGSNSNVVNLDNVSFSDTPDLCGSDPCAGAPAVNFSCALWVNVSSGTLTATGADSLNGHSFPSTVNDMNVCFQSSGSGASRIDMDAPAGSNAGETRSFDDEDAALPDANVVWNSITQWDAGGGTANWHTAANWNPDQVPGGTDSAEVPAACSPTCPVISDAAGASIKNLTLKCSGASGATLTLNSGLTLTVNNTLTVETGCAGSADFVPLSDSTVVFNSTPNTVIPTGPGDDFWHLSLQPTGAAASATGTLDVAGNLIIASGATFNGGASTIKLKGDWINGGAFNAQSSTVEFIGTGAQSGSASDYFHVTITNTSASGVLIDGNWNVDGNLVLTAGAKLDGNVNTAVTLNLAGTFCLGQAAADTATFTPGLSTVVLDGGPGVTQWLIANANANMPLNHLNVSSVSSAPIGENCTTPAASSETLDVNGNLTIGAAGTLDAANDTILLAGNFTRNGTFTNTGSTVTFDGSGSQTIAAATAFNLLTVNKSGGALTANGNVTTIGAVTLTAGVFGLSTGTHSFGGNLSVNGGVFDAQTASLTVAGNVTVAAGSSYQMTGTDAARGILTFDNSASARSMTVGGTFRTTQSGSAPLKARLTTSGIGANFTSFTINSGATLDVTGLEFTRSNTTGMALGTAAAGESITATKFTEVAFGPLCTGAANCSTQAIWFHMENGTGPTCTNCTFDASMTNNVNANSLNGAFGLTFVSFSGDRGGSGFEINDANGKISWVRTRNWTGASSALFSAAANWSPTGQGAPVPDDRCIVGSATLQPNIDVVAEQIRMLEINDGGQLSLSTAGNDLTVNADVTLYDGAGGGGAILMTGVGSDLLVGGIWTDNVTTPECDGSGDDDGLCQNAGAGRVYFTGTATIGAEPNFRAVTIRNGATVSFAAGAGVTFLSGAGAGALTIGEGASGTLNGSNATLTLDDVGPVVASGGAWNPQTGTVRLRGTSTGACTLSGSVTTVNHLEIVSGNVKQCGNLAVNGNLTVKSGATLDQGGSALTVAGSATIESSATLAVGTSSLTLLGNLTNDGALSAGSGTLSMSPSSAASQTIGGSGSFTINHLTIGSNSITLPSVNLTAAGTTTIGGTLNLGSTTYAGSGSVVLSSGSVLNLGTGTFQTSGAVTDNQPAAANVTGTGTFHFNGTSQTIPCEPYYNLKFSSAATYSLGCHQTGSNAVGNNVEIASGATLDASASSYNLEVKGHWTRTGSFTERTGTVTFGGTAPQNVATPSNFYNLTVNNGVGGSVTALGALTVSGGLTVQAGTLNLDGGSVLSHSVSGSMTLNGGMVDLKTSSLTAGSLSLGTGGTAASFLIVSNGPADPDVSVSGTVTIGANGTLDAGATGAPTLSVSGNWSDSGNFVIGNTTVALAGGAATVTSSGSGDFYNLTVDASGAKSAGSNLGISNNLKLAAGTFAIGGYTVAVAKDVVNDASQNGAATISTGALDVDRHVTPGSGSTLGIEWSGTGLLKVGDTLSAAGLQLRDAAAPLNTGTIQFDGSTAQNIPALTDATWNQYNSMTLSGSTKTVTGNLTLNGNLTVTSGTLNLDDASARNMTVGGTLTNNATVTMDLSGTLLTANGLFDNNATLNVGPGTVDQNGAFDGTGGTLNLNTGRLRYGSGATPVWGTLNEASGTVEFDGASSATVPADTYFDLAVSKSGGSVTAGGGLDINGNFTLTSGTFEPSTFSHTLYGNWSSTAGGTFAPAAGTVTLDGTSQAIALAAGQTFYHLAVAGTGTVTASTGIGVSGNLAVTTGVFTLGSSLIHSVAGTTSVSGTLNLLSSTLTVGDNLTVNAGGTLKMEDSSVLKMGSAKSVTINGANGKFATSWTGGTAVKPRMTTSGAVGTNFYSLTANSGSKVDVHGFVFESADANGFRLNSGTDILYIGNMEFRSLSNNGGSGGIALNMQLTAGIATPTTFQFPNLFCDTSYQGSGTPGAATGNVVTADAGAAVTILISNATGAGCAPVATGEAYDWDASNVTVSWIDAAKWTAGGGTNQWSLGANWSTGAPPTSSQDVVIQNFTPYPVLDVNAAVITMTINQGAQISLSNKDLSVSGDFQNDGTLNADTGTLKFEGEISKSVQSSGGSLYRIVVNKGSGGLDINILLTSTSTLTIQNELLIQSGSFQLQSGSVVVQGPIRISSNQAALKLKTGTTVTAEGNVDLTGGGIVDFLGESGVLKIGGALTVATGTVTAPNGTIEWNGAGAQTIPTLTYYNLKINKSGGSAATAGGTLDINGNLALLAGTFDPSTFAHNEAGNWDSSAGGSFAPAAGTFIFDGAASQSVKITSGQNFYNVTYAPTAAVTLTALSNLSINGAVTVSGGTLDLGSGLSHSAGGAWTNNATTNLSSSTLTVGGLFDNNAILNLNSGILDQNGAFDGTGGTLNGNSGTLRYGNGANIIWGTFNRGTGTIDFDSTGAGQTIVDPGPSPEFYDLKVSKGAQTATLGASFTLDNNLTVTSGTVDLGAGLSHTVSGGVTNNGTINLSSSTLVVAGLFDNNATINVNTGTLDQNGALDGTGGSLNGNTGTVFYGSATTPIWGTLSAGTGTFNFDTAVGVVIPGATYYHLTITKSTAMATAGATLDINGNFTLASGTFGAGTALTHTVAGNWTDAAGAFAPTTGTIIFDGSSQTLSHAAANNFFNLTVSGSGTATANACLHVNGALSVGAGTFNLGTACTPSPGHEIAGTTTVSGTLNMGTSVLTASGDVTVNSAGTLKMDGTSSAKPILRMANGKTITVNGTLATTIVSASQKPRITSTSDTGPPSSACGATFGFAAGSTGGTLDVDGLDFRCANASGLTLGANLATFTRMNRADFKFVNGTDPRHLRVLKPTANYAFDSNTFDCSFKGYPIPGTCPTTGSGYNVSTVVGAALTFSNYGGAGGGETWDEDSVGTINWSSNAQWTGSVSCNWSDAGNWDTGAVPEALTNVTIPDIGATACGGGGPYDPDVNASASANNIVINSGGLLEQLTATTLDAAGNVTINTGGAYTLNHASGRLKVGGVWSRSGAFNQTAGTVEFTGSALLNTETFSLPVVVTGSSVALAPAATVTVNNTSSANDLDVQAAGSFNLGNNGTLKLAGGAKANVAGTFRATSATAKVTSVTSGCPALGDRFDFQVSGTVNVTGLTFECGDAQGFEVSSAASITALENVAFQNAQASSCPCAHMSITRSGNFTKNLMGLSFDAANASGTPYNISLTNSGAAGTIAKLQVAKAAVPGAGWGENFEREINDCPSGDPKACVNWLETISNDVAGKTRGFPAPILDSSGNLLGIIVADDRGVGSDWIVAMDANGTKTSEQQVSGDITTAPYVFNSSAFGGAQIWIGTNSGNLYRFLWSGGTLTLATGFPVAVGNSITTGLSGGIPSGWTSPSCAADDPTGSGGTFFFAGTFNTDSGVKPAVFGYNICGGCQLRYYDCIGGSWTTASTPTLLNNKIWIGTDSEGVLRISNGGGTLDEGTGCGVSTCPYSGTATISGYHDAGPGGRGAANNSVVNGAMVANAGLVEFFFASGDDAPTDSRLYSIDVATLNSSANFPVNYADGANSGVESSVGRIGGNIYFGANNGILYGYTFSTGAVISGGGRNLNATNPSAPQSSGGADNAVKSTPLLYNNIAYFGSNNGKFYAVDIGAGSALGQVCKSWDLGNPISSQPSRMTIGGNQRITIGTDSGGWYSLAPATCP
ncbi:MAG: hypothetical protein HYT87_10685 [Nitrospirae bacterium]|nr:hypothetical protein [Nitrospirota bacterium]